MRNRFTRNQSGMSIVQILIITVGLMTLSGTIYSQLYSILKEQKHIFNKIEYAGTQSLAKDIMNTVADCNCQVSGKVFNSTLANPSFEIDRITTSCAPNAPILVKKSGILFSAQVDVPKLEVKNIVPTGNGHEYYGDLHISSPVEANKLRTLRSTPIRFMFHTVTTSPPNARVVRGCGYAPIEVPTGLTPYVGPGTGVCRFTWNASITGRKPLTYTVRGGTIAGAAKDGDRFCEGSDTSLTCQIENLTVGTRYYFAIQASNPYQEPSNFSSEVSCIPGIIPSRPAPTALAGNRQCTISWPASTGTTPITYTVFKSSSSPTTASSEVVCNSIPGTSCVSAGLINETTYFYAVKAKNIAGESEISPTVSCMPYVPPYCYLSIVTNTHAGAASCAAGFTAMKQGYGCGAPGMYDPFNWRGSSYRVVRSGLWASSGDHFAYPFYLYNNTSNSVAYNGWWNSSCYYFYHGKYIYGSWPWAACCR